MSEQDEMEAEHAFLPYAVLTEFYKYKPLPDDRTTTRLLALSPGTGDRPLTGTLQQLDLRSDSTYKALSYVWGRPGLTQEVLLIDGRKLAITPNLAAALRRFRSASEVLYIWVDQVCINQRDTIERSKQVRLMYMIYKNAAEILAWLGADGEAVNSAAVKAFGLARALLAICSDELLSSLLKRVGKKFDWIPKEHWICLKQLCEVEWFRRVWIPQEIGTSTLASVHWGSQSIDWEQLCDAMDYLDKFPALKRHHGIETSRITSLHRRFIPQPDEINEHARSSFVNQLCLSAKAEATDPRDYVFSLLGHYSASIQGDIPIIRPDYDNSIHDIYHEIAIRILRTGPALIVLNAVMHRREPIFHQGSDMNKLPSWVPQWNSRGSVDLLGMPGRFSASSDKKPEISFDQRFQQLTLHGVIVDSIKVVADYSYRSILDDLNRSKLEQFILSSWSVAATTAGYWQYRTGVKPVLGGEYPRLGESARMDHFLHNDGKVLQAFLDTLAPEAMVVSLSPNASAFESGMAVMRTCLSVFKLLSDDTMQNVRVFHLLEATMIRLKGRLKGGIINTAAWSQVAEQNALERNFAVGAVGYYVLAPPTAREGDLICVLFGGETPYILRKIGDGKAETYQLVGEAYVHGLMDGEAITKAEAGELKGTTFKIQ